YMDWSCLRTLPIGEGEIDFQKFFDYIAKNQYDEMITYEASGLMADGTVDYDKINQSLEKIRKFKKETA
ncbi:MAG: hypothetical protein J6I65_05425, partial [Lachnospiraceae bacterium]|nr:hypothetical protein [Lachnospiraceae bacterium]